MSVHTDPIDTHADPNPQVRPRLILAVLGLCGIVVALMQTLVVPIIPQLPILLDASPADTSWAVTSTLLAGAVITPISGRLGDMFGKKRMILVSLGLVVLGSVICALAPSLIVLVIGRALQGASVGAIPLGIAILRDVLPPKKVGGAMAVMSATLGVGGAVGLPVAALIAQVADWHFLFVVSAILGLICMVLVFFIIPESSIRKPSRFDFVGAIGLAAALIAFLLPITKGGTWGWTDSKTLGLLASSALIFVIWGAWELRRDAPLVNLRIAARKQVLFTNLASIAVGFAMYGNSLSLPQLLMAPTETGYGFGLSMVTTGLVLAPAGLVMMALSPVSARLSSWKGPRVTMIVGALVVGLGYVVAYFATFAIWQVTLTGMIIGAGVGLTFSAMPALIMGAVPITESAAANGLNSLMRSIGTSSSAAVVSVVLAGATIVVHDRVYPTLDMFKLTFLISIIAAAVTMIFAWLIPKQKRM